MNLSGQTVKLRLSPRGQLVLKQVVKSRIGRTRGLQAFVFDSDAEGLWVKNRRSAGGEVEILLMKWEHIEAVGFETRIAEPMEPPKIGFHW